ncbi:MAG: hypothetical protein FWE41_04615 [Coriobacteriia bacterium]|nr:hypothetical protein [Coriobacteriia bacterium]MCL2750773.1 hypothetical protein [Coriobacteriia bacterium]
MGLTIFYKGALKETKSPKDVIDIATAFAKEEHWSFEAAEDRILIDFPGVRCEGLGFTFFDGTMNTWSKLHSLPPEDFNRVLDLFYAIKPLFSEYDVSDDFGLWFEYLADKEPCNIALRELREEEVLRVGEALKRGFDESLIMSCPLDDENARKYLKGEALLRIIADDLLDKGEEPLSIDLLLTKINPGTMAAAYPLYLETSAILENWLYETMEYKDMGRLGDLYHGTFKELPLCIKNSIWAFQNSMDNTLLGMSGPTVNLADAQVRKLYAEEIFPLSEGHVIDKEDTAGIRSEAFLAYRYVVSVLDYLGFIYAGKQSE